MKPAVAENRAKKVDQRSETETAHTKTILLVGDAPAEEKVLAQLLIAKGYQVLQATTEQLIDGQFQSASPHAAVVSYNWPNNIGLRAFLLNHQELQSLPVIFSGPISDSCPGRDLNIIGRCPDPSQKEEIMVKLEEYFEVVG